MLAVTAGGSARCAGTSVGGDYAAWNAISPRPLLTLFAFVWLSSRLWTMRHSASYCGGSSGLQRRGRSQWGVDSSLGQPGRAWSFVAATVMPCMRALCVLWWAGLTACRGRCWRVCRQPLGRPLGLRCAVCSESMLYTPTLSVAGHAEALRSVRRAEKR